MRVECGSEEVKLLVANIKQDGLPIAIRDPRNQSKQQQQKPATITAQFLVGSFTFTNIDAITWVKAIPALPFMGLGVEHFGSHIFNIDFILTHDTILFRHSV
ncbi:hypothetical protein DN30_3734 [Vibrio cholerae]|nr:hypothetical protein DN30_3734 [Vibrio cholerae]